ncbi:hypothetical protein LPH50_05225 [Xylella taiwanensis]|nr:hypothetical protein [Xylella taiwanensis]EWS79450.1 hypothetical protein AF72_00690 [Xylella taiwanensis]MCD8459918.1 hypothetical protein [Xylella taiwanensis]MCD8464423.1 hypothetical protein [Xylella taiwanensis]UFN07696.1 hypothetical protein LPH42_05080 [Xylella taiwanensis]UFN09990.1 hypothetical protein LPH45_05105 [Xylella taiwanensis]
MLCVHRLVVALLFSASNPYGGVMLNGGVCARSILVIQVMVGAGCISLVR